MPIQKSASAAVTLEGSPEPRGKIVTMQKQHKVSIRPYDDVVMMAYVT
ncbi:hypothetical protein PANO111632_14355 [Paracoccus nototheniae]|uniref:Uncharacterized protein n=1 Tax=Paracoccus nototheniae TaxID=2489002 RepID=A0ABW4DY48_9RHOB|nr:hypothetical protein [Paracoccus nototheniae]